MDGDAQAIEKVVAKVEAAHRPHARRPAGDARGRRTARSRSPRPRRTPTSCSATGRSGTTSDFKDAVPHADDALALAYVSFDNEWTDALQDLAKDEDDPDATEVAANLAALRAFGASAWTDGDTGHALVRLTLK